jgi:hypothetical protein
MHIIAYSSCQPVGGVGADPATARYVLPLDRIE